MTRVPLWLTLAGLMLAGDAAAQRQASRPAAPAIQTDLTVTPGVAVAATVDGTPARLLVGSGRLDRLTLDPDYVAANRIKPTWLMGRGELSVAGRREFKGRNRPVTLGIVGATGRVRAFWFDDAPDSGADGTVGPGGLPQPRVTFVLAPPHRDEQPLSLPLAGDRDNSFATVRLDDQPLALSFDVEDGGRFPVATAAAGALIARSYGGALEGPSWDVEVLMGVKRPVRLLRLTKPMTIGPLAFDRVAVRVRDRIDQSGRGAAIAEAGEPTDPDEIVVSDKSGPTPSYALSIPRAGMAGCSRLSFDKAARKIELSCRPAVAG